MKYTTNAYENMQAWELLAERSHAEQLGHIGELMMYEIDTELARRKEAPQTQETAATPETKEIVVYNKRTKNTATGSSRWGSRPAEQITVGMWIVVDAFMDGKEYKRIVEKVNTLSETKAFMIVNGKRIKKSTWRITYIA